MTASAFRDSVLNNGSDLGLSASGKASSFPGSFSGNSSENFLLNLPLTHPDLAYFDLDMLCAPYIDPLQQVMAGERFRFSIPYGQARLLFFHGCLMGRVYYQGRCFSFPPVYQEENGQLTWRLTSAGDKFSQHEFFTLPQDILLFFFNLLKLTFKQKTILCPTQHPLINHLLDEVGWQYSSV